MGFWNFFYFLWVWFWKFHHSQISFSAVHLLLGEFIVRLLVLIGTQGELIPIYDIEMIGIFYQLICKE
jgi:hypothetical protein